MGIQNRSQKAAEVVLFVVMLAEVQKKGGIT